MSRPNKLQRYEENRKSTNVIEQGDPGVEGFAGKWQSHFFKNDHPLTLEVACGKGEYTIGLAEVFPEKNFIGIDLKGDRIWSGSQVAMQKNLNNVGFVRSRVEMLSKTFAPGEVEEIWLTFPDPRPKDRDEKHRLTNIYFLNLYRSILSDNGWFRFKTDNSFIFDYTFEVLKDFRVRNLEYTRDLYHSDLLAEHHGLKTKYEKVWTEKGETIKYMKFRFA